MSDPEVQHMEQDVGTAQALKGKTSMGWEVNKKNTKQKQVALGR